MTSDKHGAPVWMDLSTHDLQGSAQFYADVFGWEFEDQGESFGHYNLITKDGKLIGGAMSSLMGPEGPTAEPQAPTAWGVFLGTDDIHTAAAAVTDNGGQLIFDPLDVSGRGWMALALDPAGALVGLWQSEEFVGTHTTDTPGFPCWFECMTTDFDAAKPFYEAVFGWQPTDTNDAGFRYATNFPLDRVSAGLCDAEAFVDKPYWRSYVLVDDSDAAARRIQALGGAITDGPQDSPFGRLYTAVDPQGATFQILSGDGETNP
ncbi:VOC family protein [Corynebacterium breve]|uniref:VOC family protein n=1 Tax=Corynebacterium breve TaxID=3049799 RepID=A0ABY8VEF1_9CORY|nr:VOC family protein [Corynebacterium breve]WIM67888.1 VOC family protein [Corynebacterium breve]